MVSVHEVMRDAPAAWNLMNEPRNEKPNGAAEIQSWIEEVAPYLKSLAPNQLVTVGEDGFYQASNCQSNTCVSPRLYVHPMLQAFSLRLSL
jgi:mannan endo-1,4-beta-mannosidase